MRIAQRDQRARPVWPAALVQGAQGAFEAGRYGACVKALQEATTLVVIERSKAVRAALPAAPAGFKKDVDKSTEEALANPMLGAMALGVGNVVQQRYSPAEGRGASIEVTVTVDSPMLQMFQMWITNPAMLPPGSELIKYGAHDAVLKQESNGKSRSLQIVLDGNLVDVQWPTADEDALFAMFDQKSIDALAAVLKN